MGPVKSLQNPYQNDRRQRRAEEIAVILSRYAMNITASAPASTHSSFRQEDGVK